MIRESGMSHFDRLEDPMKECMGVSDHESGSGSDHMDGRVFQRLDRAAGYPYSRGAYAGRWLWWLVELVLIRPSPARCYGWRRWWLRLFGAKLSGTSGVRSSVRVMHPWLLEMGDYSILGDRVRVYNLGPVKVGDHTVVSQDVHLCAGTHDYEVPELPLLRSPITIGSGVWVCADAFVGPGVVVGDNSVVGARSVVTGDVEAGVVVAGNPARVVKMRAMKGNGVRVDGGA